MDKLIEIDKITAAYGNKTVLKDVSLTVWKDDFLGIIGPNGGGKTTLLKVILDYFSRYPVRYVFIRMGLKFLLYGLVICLN